MPEEAPVIIAVGRADAVVFASFCIGASLVDRETRATGWRPRLPDSDGVRVRWKADVGVLNKLALPAAEIVLGFYSRERFLIQGHVENSHQDFAAESVRFSKQPHKAYASAEK